MTRGPRRPPVRQPGALRQAVARRARLCLRPPERPHPGVPSRRQLRCRVFRCPRHARHGQRLGPGVLAGRRQSFVFDADGTDDESTSCAAPTARCGPPSAPPATRPASSGGCTISPSTAPATCSPRKSMAGGASRNSSPHRTPSPRGRGQGEGAAPGRPRRPGTDRLARALPHGPEAHCGLRLAGYWVRKRNFMGMPGGDGVRRDWRGWPVSGSSGGPVGAGPFRTGAVGGVGARRRTGGALRGGAWGRGLGAALRALWGEGAEAQHAAERAEDAGGGGGCGEEVGDAGFGEEGFELGGVGGGLLREGADRPAVAGGERGRAGGVGRRAVGAGRAGLAGRLAAILAIRRSKRRAVRVRRVQSGMMRDCEAGLAEEAVGYQGGEGGHDEGDPTGEVGGEGLDRGGGGCGVHGKYS